jgi:hypothetical protein
MNSKQIRDIMNHFDRKNEVFRGVFACDELEKTQLKKLPAAFIVNLDTSKQPGSHWISIYIAKNRQGYYFDSFGFKPANKHILKFLKKNCETCNYNENQLQGMNSSVCGLYSIMFVLYKMGKTLPRISPINFDKYFSKNTYVNDLNTSRTINILKTLLKMYVIAFYFLFRKLRPFTSTCENGCTIS